MNVKITFDHNLNCSIIDKYCVDGRILSLLNYKKILFFIFCLCFFPISSFANTPEYSDSEKFSIISLSELETLAYNAKPALLKAAQAKNRPIKIYLHWTGMPYSELFDAYHINIDYDGAIYLSGKSLSELRPHTYMRNSGSIGITINAAYQATPEDIGPEPPTKVQIENLAKSIAVLAYALDIPIDIEHVMTHGEAGDNVDRIFPPYENNGVPYGMYGDLHSKERWDLAILQNDDEFGSGGSTIRAKANQYLVQLKYPKKK